MKAAVLESVRNMVVKDVETPETDEKSVLLRVRSCGICGSDLKFFSYGDRIKSFPVVLGHEIAGEVAEAGSSTGFRKGDEIALANEVPCKKCGACARGFDNVCDNLLSIGTTIPGGLSEFMLLNFDVLERGPVNRMPGNMTFDEGALAEPLGCVVNGFEFARMSEGKSVLIIGAGPIGCMMLDMARAMGAGKIVIADASEKRIALAGQFGADNYIASENFLDESLDISGNGYDVVMSACNNAKAHENAIRAVAKGGFVNLFGGVARGLSDIISFPSNQMHYRQFAVGGSFSQTKEHHKKALDYISKGKINTKKLITHRFALDKIKDAFDVVEKKEGLKVMVNP